MTEFTRQSEGKGWTKFGEGERGVNRKQMLAAQQMCMWHVCQGVIWAVHTGCVGCSMKCSY